MYESILESSGIIEWRIRMQIKNVVSKPYEKSISPAISFEVEIAHIKFQEAITSVDGWVESDDGKILANVVGVTTEKLKSNEVGARDSRFDSKFIETLHKVTLIAPLARKAVDYIEKRRMENKKRDVYLTLNLNVRSIVSKARIFHLHDVDHKSMRLPPVKITTSSGRTTNGKIMAYAHDPQFSTEYTNRWIISGESSPFFLSINEQTLRKERVRIPSTDWIHDYAPKLELGEYFIVEIPKGKVVEEAWDYVKKAEECYRQWDTKGVYANCREAGSLLDTTIRQKFGKNNFIRERWGRTYQRFSNFASLDLHLEDIKKSQKFSAEGVKIGKVDVEHILIVTKALIKYAGELLQEKS